MLPCSVTWCKLCSLFNKKLISDFHNEACVIPLLIIRVSCIMGKLIRLIFSTVFLVLIKLIITVENKEDITGIVSNTFTKILNSWKIIQNGYIRIRRAHKRHSKLPVVSDIDPNLPDEYDLRAAWPNCPSIGEISDQGSCGSCWAMSAADAMTDRYCIHSNGSAQFRFSVNDLVSCCHQCGHGCHGGTHRLAWKYWVESGIVSGGIYGSNDTCQPYQFEPCEHHMKGPRPRCTKYGYTPTCERTCQPGYNVTYANDIRFGLKAYSISNNESAIRTEIFRHGSVQASIRMYRDFQTYKSGIYVHKKGKFVDEHAIRIIGWGVDNQTRTPYWIVANSFNTDWGNNGFAFVERGSNECNIEKDVTGGIPLIPDHN